MDSRIPSSSRATDLPLPGDGVEERDRDEAATKRSAGRMGMDMARYPRRRIATQSTVAASGEQSTRRGVRVSEMQPLGSFHSAGAAAHQNLRPQQTRESEDAARYNYIVATIQQQRLDYKSHTSKAAMVAKTKKRKVAHVSGEGEALTPTSLSMAKKNMSKKIVDRALAVSREVAARAKKRKIAHVSGEDEALSPLITMAPAAKKIRRTRSTTSEVWNHFHEPDENDPMATCMYCGKQYMCKSFHGTSNLWKHLRFQCPAAPLKDQDTRKKEHGTPKQSYSYEACRRALVEMIIIDEMAFRAVEGQGFLKYSNTLQPKFELPSRSTVARDAMQIFLEEKTKMKEILRKQQRISLTTDTWTSNQNLNYFSNTWTSNQRNFSVDFVQVERVVRELFSSVKHSSIS